MHAAIVSYYELAYFFLDIAYRYQFLILPDVFVVHLPHEKRETKNLYRDIGK